MDSDEKLTALKKAYADIILSISKEAAARVLASERKSARYQHELKVAKEEGVRMLLRLKQMMDFQVCEAKSTSLNQQKKIDELEAQLHEAEDIVKDLREELENVQSELGRLKKEKLQRVNEPVPCPSQRSICGKCRYKLVCSCSAYVTDRDLPSIILRGKEPGPYRNGCTQRILACERNLSDRDSRLSVETDDTKDDHNDREQESGLRLSPDTAVPENEPRFAKYSEKENHHVEICYGRTTCKDQVTTEVVPLKEKIGFSDCLLKLDAEEVELPSEGLESNSSDVTNGLVSQPVKERVIKYTFQRKRKRHMLSEAEVDGSIETERQTVDAKRSDKNIEQAKPNLTMESTRESRRLAQVARQLISLSERKWWN